MAAVHRRIQDGAQPRKRFGHFGEPVRQRGRGDLPAAGGFHVRNDGQDLDAGACFDVARAGHVVLQQIGQERQPQPQAQAQHDGDEQDPQRPRLDLDGPARRLDQLDRRRVLVGGQARLLDAEQHPHVGGIGRAAGPFQGRDLHAGIEDVPLEIRGEFELVLFFLAETFRLLLVEVQIGRRRAAGPLQGRQGLAPVEVHRLVLRFHGRMLRGVARKQGVAFGHRRPPAFQGHPHVGAARNVGRQFPRLLGIQLHRGEHVQQLLFEFHLAFDLGQRVVERQERPLDRAALALQHVHLVFLPRIQQILVRRFQFMLLRLRLGLQPRHGGIGGGPVFGAGAGLRPGGVGVAGLDREFGAPAPASDPDQPRPAHEHEIGPALEHAGQFRLRDLVLRKQFPVARHDVREHRLAPEFFDLRVQRVFELDDGGGILDQRLLLVEDARPPDAQFDGGPGLVDSRRLGQEENRGPHAEQQRQQDRQPFLAGDLQQPQRIERIQRTGVRRGVSVVGRQRSAAVIGRTGRIDGRPRGRRRGNGGRRRGGRDGVHRSLLVAEAGGGGKAAAASPAGRAWPRQGSAASKATQV